MTSLMNTCTGNNDFDIQSFLKIKRIPFSEMTKAEQFQAKCMDFMTTYRVVILISIITCLVCGAVSALIGKPINASWPSMAFMTLAMAAILGLSLELLLDLMTLKSKIQQKTINAMVLRIESLTMEQIDELIAHPLANKEVVALAKDVLLDRMKRLLKQSTI